MSDATRPLVVFDCMTYLQATTSPTGRAAACLRLFENGRLQLLVTHGILDEVRDVLSRPRIRQRNPALTDEIVNAFLARVAELAPPTSNVPAVFSYARDPKDEPYLNLAIATSANYIVSWDNDLRDLMRADNADGQALRALAPALQIVTPPEFLATLRDAEAKPADPSSAHAASNASPTE